MPPAADDIKQEMMEQAEAHYRGLSFSYDEFESVLNVTSDLTEIHSYDTSYFVLGSYTEDARMRLEQVRDQLDARSGARAILMSDIANEWEHSYPKFRLIADYTTYLVGVAEHRCGGFLVEMGYFAAVDQYFEKTYVLKLAYRSYFR